MLQLQILAIFHNINFFLKKLLLYFFFSLKFYLLCLMFCLSDILWQRDNLNNTYQYNMISKTFLTMILLNYINKIQSESFFVPVSVFQDF
jgi:hypothetical protein